MQFLPVIKLWYFAAGYMIHVARPMEKEGNDCIMNVLCGGVSALEE